MILTYSYSKLVEKALLDAAEAGKKIKVIVADERMESLGRKLTSSLVSAGLHTTYILITAVSQILPSVELLNLGSPSADRGSMSSRAGPFCRRQIAFPLGF